MRVPTTVLFTLLILGALPAPGGVAAAAGQVPASEVPEEAAGPEAAAVACDHGALADLEVIDLHAHVLNLDYVPLKGLFYSVGVPWPLAGKLARLLHGATPTIDPTAAPRPAAIPPAEELAGMSREQLTARVEDRLLAHDPGAVERLERYRPRLSKALARHRLREAVEADAALAAEPARQEAVEQTLERQYAAQTGTDLLAELLYLTLLRDEGDPESMLVATDVEPASVRGTLRTIEVLMSDEAAIVAQAQRDFPEVDLFVHHMMDMERVYDDRPPLPFAEQIRHARWLGEAFPGRLAAFVAFDPFRRDFALVDQGVAAGAAGVKFYPPAGYRPRSTPVPPKPKLRIPITASLAQRRQYRSRYRDFDGPRIDALTLEFFTQAAERGVPIFSHQTDQGLEAHKGCGRLMGEPCHWQKVFRKLAEESGGAEDPSPLTVIFAHSGGTGSWIAGDAEGWRSSFALQAYNLCVTYENVYCDLGFAPPILDAEGPANFARRLERLLSKPVDPARPIPDDLCAATEEVAPRYDLGTKLVYGSDWLVMRHARRADAACRFNEAFQAPALQPYRAAFFGGNARRALGMEPAPPAAQSPGAPPPGAAPMQ